MALVLCVGYRLCTTSQGQDGWCNKAAAQANVPLTNKGIITIGQFIKCIDILWSVQEWIDESIAYSPNDSGETTCEQCLATWEQ